MPPVLDDVAGSAGLHDAAAGALTALPVWCYGVVALAATIAPVRNLTRAMLLALAAIALGTVLRVAPTVVALFAGTAVIGCASGVINVLLPAAIKRAFPRRASVVTGLHATALAVGAALAAATSVTLVAAIGHGWRPVLALPAAPVLAAAAWWAWAFSRSGRDGMAPVRATGRPTGPWHDPRAWTIAAFMGFQALLYYSGLAWLPAILQSAGWSAEEGGLLLGLYNLIGLGPSLVLPALAGRFPRGWGVTPGVIGVAAAGIVGLLCAPSLAYLWVALFGLGQGGTMGLAYAFIILHADDEAQTAKLAGMVQFVGYVLAAVGPIGVGALSSATGGWTWPLLALALANVPGLAIGMAATLRR